VKFKIGDRVIVSNLKSIKYGFSSLVGAITEIRKFDKIRPYLVRFELNDNLDKKLLFIDQSLSNRAGCEQYRSLITRDIKEKDIYLDISWYREQKLNNLLK
jgi:hypothetical protein